FIDMSMLYSKYQNEARTEYNECTSSIIACEDIILSQSSYNIQSEDEVIDLNNYITLVPANTTQVVTFNAVDPSNVHVSLDGVVRPLREGTTTIIIRCGNQSAEFSVNVNFALSNAKEELNVLLDEQQYVQNIMVTRGINSDDKLVLDSLIRLSMTMLNS